LRVHVGTSGWSYRWNRGGLKGYVERTPFDTVELNSSFYKIPPKEYVMKWAEIGKSLIWSVKVYRGITHVSRFGPKSYELWERFRSVMEPLDGLTAFYLFQLPPSFGPEEFPKLKEFLEKISLGRRAAVEFRNPALFEERWLKELESVKATFVSVDGRFRYYARTGPYTYLRLHGRGEKPYRYSYSDEELEEIAQKLVELGGEEAFVYFNNDDMYRNALKFVEIVKRLGLYAS